MMSDHQLELTDTAYDILKIAMDMDADFMYGTTESFDISFIEGHQSDLVEILQSIKIDRKRHMHMPKEALEEIHR
jgi:hypothetical protein